MQRGKRLEKFMNEISAFLNFHNIHMHKNQPERTFDGRYLKGEPFDYEIFAPDKVHCFDVKENYSHPNSWHFKFTGNMAEKGNARLLRQCETLNNCKGYFLVYFGHAKSQVKGKLFYFQPNLIKICYHDGLSEISYHEGNEWQLTQVLGLNDKECREKFNMSAEHLNLTIERLIANILA